MKRWHLAILIAAVLFLNAASENPRSDQHKAQSAPSQKDIEKQQSQVPSTVFRSIRATPSEAVAGVKQQAITAQKEAETRGEDFLSPPVVVNEILALVGFGYLVFASLQWRTMRQSLQVTQRAYVNVQWIRPIESVQIGAELDAIVEYKNSGSTPAKHLWISTGFDFVNPSYMPSELPRDGRAGNIRQMGIGQILPPNVSRQLSIGFMFPPNFPAGFKNTFSDEMVNEIEAGRSKWVVWVTIDYVDYFGQRHDSVETFVYNRQTKAFEPSRSGFYQSD